MTRQYEKRYTRIQEKMDMLSITDVSTPRQEKNGTRVWRLPIKINYPGNAERFIEVASFKTGYVRNQNCGYSNYQLNKRCDGEPEYFQLNNGDFRKFTTRSCILIPNEIDRLEYLIGYCLKNYYIKKANEVTDGKYVSKWEHEYKLERQSNTANHQFEMNALQNKLANSVPTWKYKELEDRVYELESQVDNKERHYQNLLKSKRAKDCLITSMSETVDGRNEEIIDLKAQLHMVQEELSATKVRQDVSVIVNGHRYKVL